MQAENISDRKSRIILQRADGRPAEVRTIENATLIFVDSAQSWYVDGTRCTIVIKEAAQEDVLRNAVIYLEPVRRARRPTWSELAWWLLGAAAVGAAFMRAWFVSCHTVF